MKIPYVRKRFKPESLARIARANEIIEQYQEEGFILTLRQLYYQFVARGWLPNTERSYDSLGLLISNARLAGLIDWRAIEDRTRFLRGRSEWIDPLEILAESAERFRIDVWIGQSTRPEIWVEKDALVGIISNPCHELGVDYFACRGYPSLTSMHDAALRMRYAYRTRGQKTKIFHFGDHDPSGLDMSADIQKRLATFEAEDAIEFERVALNMDQIERYRPPPNPAKPTDSRYYEYRREYGEECWELDALEPRVIDELVRKSIESCIDDRGEWDGAVKQENVGRRRLSQIARRAAVADSKRIKYHAGGTPIEDAVRILKRSKPRKLVIPEIRKRIKAAKNRTEEAYYERVLEEIENE